MLGRLPFCILGELGRGHSYCLKKTTGFLFHVNTIPILFDQLLLGLFAYFFVLQNNNNSSWEKGLISVCGHSDKIHFKRFNFHLKTVWSCSCFSPVRSWSLWWLTVAQNSLNWCREFAGCDAWISAVNFCTFQSVWAVSFLQRWKRKSD